MSKLTDRPCSLEQCENELLQSVSLSVSFCISINYTNTGKSKTLQILVIWEPAHLVFSFTE